MLAQGHTITRNGERPTTETFDAETLASGRLGKSTCKQQEMPSSAAMAFSGRSAVWFPYKTPFPPWLFFLSLSARRKYTLYHHLQYPL
jgi:hypothetical protein